MFALNAIAYCSVIGFDILHVHVGTCVQCRWSLGEADRPDTSLVSIFRHSIVFFSGSVRKCSHVIMFLPNR